MEQAVWDTTDMVITLPGRYVTSGIHDGPRSTDILISTIYFDPDDPAYRTCANCAAPGYHRLTDSGPVCDTCYGKRRTTAAAVAVVAATTAPDLSGPLPDDDVERRKALGRARHRTWERAAALKQAHGAGHPDVIAAYADYRRLDREWKELDAKIKAGKKDT